MNSKKDMLKVSTVLYALTMLLLGFAVGLNVGSQLFTERPDFITWIVLGAMLLSGAIIPFVVKKEQKEDNKK